MNTSIPLRCLVFLVACAPVVAAIPNFRKIVLTTEYIADGVNAGDFNRDGHLDVVAGPYLYEGPNFTVRHEVFSPEVFPTDATPTNSLFSFPYDFDGDGWLDVLVLGRVKVHEAAWFRNPGPAGGRWTRHFAIPRVFGESPGFGDIDGDGRPEILAHWEGRWGWWSPNWDQPTLPWKFTGVTAARKIAEFYHGEGFGDIDGDGRNDIVTNEGWWQQPPVAGQPWIEHPFRLSRGRGGAQIYVFDVDGDGRNDVVTALDAHGWGLSWFEQILDSENHRSFREHRIMGSREEESVFGVAFSQPHAINVADIDGDGHTDLLVGKRRWAHGPSGDVEPMAAPVVYWFQATREQGNPKFVPRLVDDNSGAGTQINAADLNDDGVPDIMSASKLGVFIFLSTSRPMQK